METFTDDTIVALASYLSPHDMVCLALSCKRFGAKYGTTDKKQTATRDEDTREVRQKTESISLMEVAARTVLQTKWTDEEKNALLRRDDESWIGLYQEFLRVFRLPLQFDKLVGVCIKYVEDTDKTTVCSNDDDESEHYGTAICSNIMRAGKHYVSFQVDDDAPTTNGGIACGIIRPTTKNITNLPRCNPINHDLSRFSLKDYEMLHNNNVDCCLFDTCTGEGLFRKRWREWTESELIAMDEGQRLLNEMQNVCIPTHWQGMEEIRENLFKIGMVLDLDEGTLDVYKNDRRLGTLKRGLVGEYCWAVLLAPGGTAKVSVSISR